jgi:alkylation response protein AidB-like acyl-CoA dehydrogenase
MSHGSNGSHDAAVQMIDASIGAGTSEIRRMLIGRELFDKLA